MEQTTLQEENNPPQQHEQEPLSSETTSIPKEDKDTTFECNICLESAVEPVISLCGHLFCWSCIFQWIQSHGERPCPVCKSVLSKDKLIPLYGRGKEQKDPRLNPGPRPQAQYVRSEPQPQNAFSPFSPFGQVPFQTDNNVNFSIGFGFFPSLFGLQFQPFPSPIPAQQLPQDQMDSIMLSRAFLLFGIIVLLCLIMF